MNEINEDSSIVIRLQYRKIVAEVAEYLEDSVKEFFGGCAEYEFQKVCFEILKRSALNISAINKLTEGFIDNRHYSDNLLRGSGSSSQVV